MHSFLSLILLSAALGLGCGKVVIDGQVDGGGGASAAVTSSSSSSGPVDCADDGDCIACFACSAEGPCQKVASACDIDPDCKAFQDCTSGCQDIGAEECLTACTGQYPQGAAAYLAWVDCGACTICARSCEVAFSFYCHD
jgi:hypothetical protein